MSGWKMQLVPLPEDVMAPSDQVLNPRDRLGGQQQGIGCAKAVAKAPEHLYN